MTRIRPLAATLLLSAAMGAPSIAQTVPAPTPTPLAPATAAPQIGPAPSPTPTGVPNPVAQPTPAATAVPTLNPWGFVFLPRQNANGAPQAPGAPVIREFDLTAMPITAPSDVRGRILTNPEVVSVVVRLFGHEEAIPRVAPGDFEAAGHIPPIPFFMSSFIRGDRDLQIVAAVADGRTATADVTIAIR
jgi:hypothetical protein